MATPRFVITPEWIEQTNEAFETLHRQLAAANARVQEAGAANQQAAALPDGQNQPPRILAPPIQGTAPANNAQNAIPGRQPAPLPAPQSIARPNRLEQLNYFPGAQIAQFNAYSSHVHHQYKFLDPQVHTAQAGSTVVAGTSNVFRDHAQMVCDRVLNKNGEEDQHVGGELSGQAGGNGGVDDGMVQ